MSRRVSRTRIAIHEIELLTGRDNFGQEIWTHVLAYNLIRTIMAQSAFQHEISPGSISFKATLQTLEAFQHMIACQEYRWSSHREVLYQHLLHAIAQHRVADRPDRFEPRKEKRRPQNYARLMKPRQETKREMLKGFHKN